MTILAYKGLQDYNVRETEFRPYSVLVVLQVFAPPGYNYLNQSPSTRTLISGEISVYLSDPLEMII